MASSGIAWQESIKRIGAVKTSLVYYTMPIFTSIMSVIFLSEPIQIYHIIGFCFILLGIIASNIMVKYESNPT
ncbi:MAG TPA: hypothetical protein DIV86_06610 [Alphaproteobacteria bacterium]|nr:hypothetical protein [Alphaproteobacteria bacterium]